jgi:hypothetical protein
VEDGGRLMRVWVCGVDICLGGGVVCKEMRTASTAVALGEPAERHLSSFDLFSEFRSRQC